MKKMTSEQYEKWAKENNIFLSKVLYKITLPNFTGIYILNSYKFNWFPKFYGMRRKFWIECGFNWLGFIVEFQYNK